MIDIHSHLIPNVDDGSDSLENSLKYLKFMESVGVETLVLTPHFIRDSVEYFEDIDKNYKLLVESSKQENIKINLVLAKEVMLYPSILDDIEKFRLNISGTNYILVETNFQGFPDFFDETLYRLLKNGYRPILAHPERYSDIMDNIELANELMHRNILLQINSGSFYGLYGRKVRKTVQKLFKKGYCHFVAGDFHGHADNYSLHNAVDLIRNITDDFSANLLSEENPSKMLNNEDIRIFYVHKIIPEDDWISKIKRLLQL